MTTTTTATMTIRQALKIIRADLKKNEGGYISGNTTYLNDDAYQCEDGILYVRNARSSDGGRLLGVYEIELVALNGQTVRKYKA